jgi:Cu/Ag efflux protein CusF
MKVWNVLVAALFAASGVAQAQMAGDSMSMPTPMKDGKAAQSGASVMTEGVVQGIDGARGEVVLKHGDITNLGMPAMTMAFGADKAMLGRIKVGDKVRFHAELKNGKPALTKLEPR